MTAAACPPEDELVRMLEGALADSSLAQLEAHVDGCDKCATLIAELGALGTPSQTARLGARPPVAGGGTPRSPKSREPRRIGRYQLDRRIAAGGMGEVWAGWDPELRREVAVKLVRPDRLADDTERARLLREARALARVGHPNVLAVYDVGELDGEVFIVTELVAGDTLASRAGATADWRILTGLYAQAARGLAAAHAGGLVHRDVKPANLLLGIDGRVRVADFGLAVRSRTPALATVPPSDGEASVTATGHIAGTPAYMAPEQRAGAPADARVDQYALCIALAEGIAGRRPPNGELDRDALIELISERREREPALDELCRVIARGLASEPDARFATANELADALEAVVPNIPVTPAAPDRRRRLIVRLAIGTLVTALAAGAVMIATREATPTQPAAAAPASAIAVIPAPPGATPLTPPAARTGSGSSAPRAARSDAVVVRDRPVAIRTPPSPTVPSSPVVTPPPVTASSPDPGKELDLADAAIDRHDATGCRALLARLPDKLADARRELRLAELRARCEMVAGNCDGGLRQLTDRFPMPPAGATAVADLYCLPGDEPVLRLHRLVVQTTRRGLDRMDCAFYVEPTRAARRAARNDSDRMTVASVMTTLARCFSAHQQCSAAHALAAEATALVPSVDAEQELLPDCR